MLHMETQSVFAILLDVRLQNSIHRYVRLQFWILVNMRNLRKPKSYISLETQLPELSRLVLWGAGFIHASKSHVAVP